jgi:hypothetical protein
VKELSLDHAIDVSLDRFPALGEAVQPRRRITRLPRDWRLFIALCIWAVGFLSISFMVSFAHDDVADKTQADSVLCKRQ